ncbi:MAG: hypothetical protein U0132_01960 [Gemmatimonadaceae bacterium]
MIDVAIVGFGFTAVPLIRELERTGTPFMIITAEENSVWDGLSKNNRLDFDLVSSYLTSFYSFDLTEMFERDGYPTAREFYGIHLKWRAAYKDKLVMDEVTRVDNYDDHSVLYTRAGQTIKARHVVFSTGFGRAIIKDLKTIDYSAPAKTAVFDTMGDSANLIIAQLIPNDVKVIIRTNGFHARDKVVPSLGTTYTLDQLEFQNYRYVSHEHYADIIYGAHLGSDNPYLLGDQFPDSVRDESYNRSRSRPVNGAVAIKYWPIDEYARRFGADLPRAIGSGYLLNDIAMWLHTGKAIVVPKDTPIDHERQTITYGGVERKFDMYVEGDAETPRLPTILAGGTRPYAYVQRETFMGVIPQSLHNVYLMGFTRPYTGGLANIIEMQGLFVHKMITQPDFHRQIHQNLAQRIAAYNAHYYVYDRVRRYEHLVYYGFYTDEIARLLGIDYKVSDCRTVQDLLFYYAFPNNAFKYRLRGEYAVPGVRALIAKVNREFNYFVFPFAFVLASGGLSDAERARWLSATRRNFFNDMRHKEDHRPFMERYLQTFRQVRQLNGNGRGDADPEWTQLVAAATQARDRAMERVQVADNAQMDADLANEVERLVGWLTSHTSLKDLDTMELEPSRRAMLQRMLAPGEFELGFV